MGERAEATLKEASLLAPSASNVSSSHFKRNWSIRLAVCLQKENAEMIHNKILSIVGKTSIGRETVNISAGRFPGLAES